MTRSRAAIRCYTRRGGPARRVRRRATFFERGLLATCNAMDERKPWHGNFAQETEVCHRSARILKINTVCAIFAGFSVAPTAGNAGPHRES